MFHHFPDQLGRDDTLVRSLDLTYDENPTASCLTRVTEFGHVLRPPPADADRYLTAASAARRRSATATCPMPRRRGAAAGGGHGAGSRVRGRGDARSGTIWVDLDGEGVAGLLSEHRRCAVLPAQHRAPAAPTTAPRSTLADAARRSPAAWRSLATGGGSSTSTATEAADLAVPHRGTRPAYPRRTGDGWDDFRTFESSAHGRLSTTELRWIDLDGDGRADLPAPTTTCSRGTRRRARPASARRVAARPGARRGRRPASRSSATTSRPSSSPT